MPAPNTLSPLRYALLAQQAQATLLRSLLGNLPPATHWKVGMQGWIDDSQRLNDVRQTQQLDTWKECRERFDLPGLLQLAQLYADTGVQLQKDWMNWLQGCTPLLSESLFSYARHNLDARGDGDALLALNALDQDLRPRWNAHMGDLMGLMSGVMPAYMTCLERYLQADAQPDMV
jgi:hypothetical protein